MTGSAPERFESDILVVEDDRTLSEALCDTLGLAGYRVRCAADGGDALAQLDKYPVKLVLSDVKMAPMDGRTLLRNIKRRWPELPVLLMTAYGTIEQAVRVIQAGACDYLVKPFSSEVLERQVERYISLSTHSHCESTTAPAMRRMYELARRVAPTDATVLILGESGTGKEVLARYLHRHSPRQGGPFVAINCAAIPDQMLEAELFGYEKGAFTGAYQSTPGKLEMAHGGTILLDEISEMVPALQAKLLRVLQEREVERIGGRQILKLDVRVLATSNRNLRDEVTAGRFREDLFYRINVFPLQIPPLRDRRRDIVPLAEVLLKRHAGGNRLPSLSEEAVKKLQSYSWPGNVRELENVIQRALILTGDGRIRPSDLIFDEPDCVSASDSRTILDQDDARVEERKPVLSEADGRGENGATKLEESVRCAEERIILTTLMEENGSRSSTAKRLGISPRTLRYKIAKMREAGVSVPG
ncbi:MAG: sigma-54-dependent Fis family transcriptional regulator [Methylothermaceae bacterium]|nr:sigma-54-dependent Fis family transcriptional regulator [Methylothermaceae bacterium]